MTSVTSTSPTSITDLMSTMNVKTAAASADSVDADTNKFMTLLVTQLKNQDPMNPLDNAQLTSQLAQLSTVTGVNKLNTTLESLKTSYQSSEAMSATNMIGHGVFVDDNFVNLSKGQSILGVDLATGADNVTVTVTDPATGKDIKTIELGAQKAGILPLSWDGIADGATTAMKDGKYTFRVSATNAGTPLVDAKTLAFDSVSSVSTSAADGVKLNLPTKGQVTLADIKQVM
ncbi:MAG: flagellar biosynthesis protein FlgD [Pseudomonadota bacterium]|nr:flagellar biosynthesis protein FlgD [Pseudomonadota bacterium]